MSEVVSVKVGIWDGSRTCRGGQLLFRALMADAMAFGVRGCTVCRSIEGGASDRTFRSVENEVASNELPIWMELADDRSVLSPWLPRAKERLQDDGIVVVEQMAWSSSPGRGRLPAEGTVASTPERGRAPAVTGRELAKADGIGMPKAAGRDAFTAAKSGGPKAAGEAGGVPGDAGVAEGKRRMAAASGTGEVVSGASLPGIHVQVYTLERNRVNGKPVYQAVAEFLRGRQVLWMSTSRGVCGFGERRALHRPRWWFQRSDAPVVMHIVDEAERLSVCLPELARLVGGEALIVSSPVELYHVPARTLTRGISSREK
ncbi:MAG: DUF190 domain-containing protein [Alicyclobacillus sp.]|nr:DUF190 domain-containing protein [Alicyclobacillus sp.]